MDPSNIATTYGDKISFFLGGLVLGAAAGTIFGHRFGYRQGFHDGRMPASPPPSPIGAVMPKAIVEPRPAYVDPNPTECFYRRP